MSAITLPDALVKVRERTFRLTSSNLASRGLFSGQVNPYGPVARRWTAGLEMVPQKREQWQDWDGLIADLGGISGRVRTGDPARKRPYYDTVVVTTTESWDDATDWDDGTGWSSGELPPTVAVAVAAARGASAIVLAFPAGFESLSAVLRRGDLLEIRPGGIPAEHGHLYTATATANTDATGQSGLSIAPALRAGIAAGDTVVLRNPTTVFALASDDEGEIGVDVNLHGRLGLTLIEVLPR